ncbi:MAG: molybdenum cofactor biosynthesis protein MoaE [Acidobacteriota bacterium]
MVEITQHPIDPQAMVAKVAAEKAGALVTFDGVVRNQARGKRVTHLFYEGYSPMALKELERIRQEALKRWPGTRVAIAHRLGRLEIGESSVFIAVSSAHRAAAFEACRHVIDTLKTSVPIWKKEHYEDGETWIEGYSQAGRPAHSQ